MREIVAFIGPTASGKTKMAIDYALNNNAEIINCDSMQIYSNMEIGTASPTQKEKEMCTHHLFNFISPLTTFSVSDYVKLATMTANSVFSSGNNVVLVGGTGFYLDSFRLGREFSEFEIPSHLNNLTTLELKSFLREKQDTFAENIHDRKRLIRRAGAILSTGKFLEQLTLKKPQFKFKFFAKRLDREKLYDKINIRTANIFEGLIKESENLLKMGITPNHTAYHAIGYKQCFAYLNGFLTKEEALYLTQTATRQYAKRQMTWFKRNKEIIWI